MKGSGDDMPVPARGDGDGELPYTSLTMATTGSMGRSVDPFQKDSLHAAAVSLTAYRSRGLVEDFHDRSVGTAASS